MEEKELMGLETVKPGMSNGISTQLWEKRQKEGLQAELTEEEKNKIIEEASFHYGNFLTALGCDWRSDPNADRTPYRVAKAFVRDSWAGRFNPEPKITAFPADGYSGIVQESNIPLTSMCSHHHERILGTVSIAYVPSETGKVIGLSKLNRITSYIAERGQIQEAMTVAIHSAVDKICKGNLGVAVQVNASHACVQCRGVKHQGASMQTAKLSGCFLEEASARAEFYKNIELAKK